MGTGQNTNIQSIGGVKSITSSTADAFEIMSPDPSAMLDPDATSVGSAALRPAYHQAYARYQEVIRYFQSIYTGLNSWVDSLQQSSSSSSSSLLSGFQNIAQVISGGGIGLSSLSSLCGSLPSSISSIASSFGGVGDLSDLTDSIDKDTNDDGSDNGDGDNNNFAVDDNKTALLSEDSNNNPESTANNVSTSHYETVPPTNSGVDQPPLLSNPD